MFEALNYNIIRIISTDCKYCCTLKLFYNFMMIPNNLNRIFFHLFHHNCNEEKRYTLSYITFLFYNKDSPAFYTHFTTEHIPQKFPRQLSHVLEQTEQIFLPQKTHESWQFERPQLWHFKALS